ncbi:MAG: Uma2 family endonuclease [Sporichthyaceae bacterium]
MAEPAVETAFVAQHGRPFTVDDLETMPDDGRRYELIDGMLLVAPAPGWAHQEMSAAVYRQLFAIRPPDLRVLIAPFAVRASSDSEVQPDVLVTRYADLTAKNLPVAPLLAVETLSRSTRLYDRNLKQAYYARIGVRSYWVLDPTEPGSIAAYTLVGDRYREVGSAAGDEELALTEPFPVTVVPARLLDELRPQ